jgi:ABC-2 type transport system ATP-binding protein
MTTNTLTHTPRTLHGSGSPAIVARGLTKRYGDATAVCDLSFDVRPGRVTGFLGPNGAGKSTTLRMLLGLVQPTAGEATVLGEPYGALDRPMRAVGAVLETQSFHPLRSGRNHLRVLATASGIPPNRVAVVLEQVGLTPAADRRAGTYSLGMRQRLSLAAALLGDPQILILDEPANGLDPAGIRWLRELLRGVAAGGRAVLVSSHLLAEMGQLADDLIVVHRGRLVRHCTVAELTAGAALRVATPEVDRLAAALKADGMTVAPDGADRLTVRNGSAERVGAIALAATLPLTELTTEHGTLEDVFLDLTTEETSR